MLHTPSLRRTVAPGRVAGPGLRPTETRRRGARALAALALLVVLAGGFGALLQVVPPAVANALLVVGVTCVATLAGAGAVVLVRRGRKDGGPRA
ncbi:hypothetical protein ACTHAM_001326 [Cellulomonas soli]|uniref:hypothetical protein n=1 Tax=Cellulomonas soli TaxID=931535 RepID=UPI003F86813A